MARRAGPLLMLTTLVAVACTNLPRKDPTISAKDPGVRSGPAGAGGPLAGLTEGEAAFFRAGREAFLEIEAVKDGLGPRFNLDGCAGCHAQPDAGGPAPRGNPQGAEATQAGATDRD